MYQKVKSLILLLLIFIAGLTSFAQNDEPKIEIDNTTDGKGWIFGLNVGVYYPSKATASYYNGNTTNVNNSKYAMSNKTWYNDIYEALVAHDTVFVSGLPENMHYKLALSPGIYAQYCFNTKLALVIQFNYMKLKANDVIIFEVDPKQPVATNPDLRLYPIRGVEERVYADIGLKRTFPHDEKLSYFLMGGVNVNSTRVKKCSFYVEDLEYNMINIYGDNSYVPNSNIQSFNVYQGGIGVGMFAGAGAALNFNGIVIEPGITAHWLMVNLGGYQNMNPGIGANIRFMF